MRRSLAFAAMLLAVVATARSAGAQLPDARIQAGRVVRPDTVTVADPFVYTVTVQVPRDARVEWPSIDDTAAVVSQRAPVAVRSVPDGGTRRETAQYLFAAWDTGQVEIALADARVRVGDITMRVPMTAQVYVRSVLPADTSLHVPKPAKDLFPREVPGWERWWPVLLLLLALLLLWWLLRRRKRRGAPRVTKPLDLYERAMEDFARLERLALADAGERGRFVALAVEILRMYLVGRVPSSALSQTSSELVTSVRDDTRVPVTRLAPLLGQADAIKFARLPVDTVRARELAAEARAIVDDIERAEQARRAAEAAERAARERDKSVDRQRAEDEARRQSRRKGAA